MALTRAQLVDPNCEIRDSDYDAIEAAIMETSRGRWFLSEYARRNRHSDTILLLSAINRIKESFEICKNGSHPYLVSTDVRLSDLANHTSSSNDSVRLNSSLPRTVPMLNEMDTFQFKN